ncbi:nucleoside phosphorylase [Tundrisphaera lichenicola]|uniref:phosphorylase family protein n=1 Tax=Tundrisphaera lichenicola TaxID=2029860 RepID=UPI003EBBD4F5
MSAGPSANAPAPAPADIGVVAALSIEVAPLLARLENVRKYSGPKFSVVEGECGSQLVVVVLTGTGRARAQRGAEILLDGHRPRWIISAGFGGALDPSLKRNEIILPSEVVNLEGRRFAIDLEVPPGAGLRSGRLLTVDEIVRTAAEKAELRRKYEADVVDMESSSVAALCGDRGVRFLSVRVVSDDAKVDLPPEVLSILGRSGGLRLGATLGALWKRPSSVKDLLALREHAIEAADRLCTFLVGTFPRLP